MKKFLIATTAASALLISACSEEPEVAEVEDTAYEETVTPMTETAVADWDANDDGMFQQAEYNSWSDQGLTGWDTDGDAQLTAEEFNTGWTGAGFTSADSVFTAWDDNSDGFLTDDEFFDDEEWTEWDADNSGMLEQSEFGYY